MVCPCGTARNRSDGLVSSPIHGGSTSGGTSQGAIQCYAKLPSSSCCDSIGLTILVVLLFSKNAYTASFTSLYTFYLMGQFNISLQSSQMMLFLFLASSAAGVLVGGTIGDKIGR